MMDAVGQPLEQLIAEVRRRYSHCFGCGPDNPLGLKMEGFAVHGDEVAAAFDPHPEHNGFRDVLHGGIVAAALDEICAWAAMAFADTYVVTGKFEVRYARPAPAHGRYDLRARIDERRKSRLRISGSLAHDAAVVATAAGLYLPTAPVGTTAPKSGA